MTNKIMTNEMKRKYNAFWAHEYDGRAILQIEVPSPASFVKEPDDPAEKWESIPSRIKSARQFVENTRYLAEGLPNAWVNLGPGVLAAMLGSDYTYYPGTVWFGEKPGEKPMIREWSDMDNIALSPDNRMNRLVLEMTERFCKDSGGDYLVGITDIGGTLDILASLRGTEQLLTDLYDEPEEVEKAAAKIDALWLEAFSQSYSLLQKYNPDRAMTAWIPIWCTKSWFPLQCDFSAMLSPEHFGRFVMPSLVKGTDFLEHSVYHLDGVGEIPHLDMLLSIKRLDAIQWVPGDGKPGYADDGWFPLYERIQTAGKGLVLTGVSSAEDMLYLLKRLSHKGLFISGWLKSAEEAEEVIRKAEEYAKC
ncbi:MAG: hypothetical protein FWF44_01690 [Defluviitaleaceae bacterium]|nr:hypothetical protein [Defluviitaleaceae bacterium]